MGFAEFLGSGLLSLAIGGLIGLERQRVPKRVLGTRTFALVSFLGFLLAFFSQGAWWLPAIGLVGCFALAVGYYYFRVKRSYYLSESIGLTTTFMLPLSFFLGVLAGYGFFLEAGLSAIAAVYLLLEKREVHAFAKTISKQEIIDLLLFVIIAFIVYPQLPLTPASVLGFDFDLRYFWTIVVLVSSISFVSHFLTKYVKHNAVFYSAVLGGLVSSLATVSLFASRTKDKAVLYSVLAASSLSSLASNILLLLLIAPVLLREVGLILFLQLLGFIAVVWHYYRKSRAVHEAMHAEKRALSLAFTFEFAIVFFVVSLLISFSSQSLPVLLASAFFGGVVSSTSVFAAIAYQHEAGGLPQSLTALALIATVLGSQFSKSFVLWLALGERSLRELALLAGATAALGLIGFFLHGL